MAARIIAAVKLIPRMMMTWLGLYYAKGVLLQCQSCQHGLIAG
jgi:hypothetical protein